MVAIRAGSIVLGAREVDPKALSSARGVPAPRGLLKTRIADVDEDALTLAVEVGRAALARAGLSPDQVDQVFFASPERPDLDATLAEALGIRQAPVARFADMPETAADMLLAALGMHQEARSLVIVTEDGRTGTEVPPPGRAAGAAALVVGPGEGATLVAERHARGVGLLEPAATDLRPIVAPDSEVHPTTLVAPEHLPGDASRLAHMIKLTPHELPTAHVGDLGAAGPLVALLDAVGRAPVDHRLLWVVPGDAGWSAALFHVGAKVSNGGLHAAVEAGGLATDPAVAERIATVWARSGHAVAQGAFVSRQQFEAQAAARYRFEGQRCEDCGKVSFPPRETCPGCAAARLATVALSGHGTVHARTRIGAGGAPTEFAPLQNAVGPYGVAIVELEEGPRVAAMVAGGADGLQIGEPVELCLRLLYVQEGRPRYGFKARPRR